MSSVPVIREWVAPVVYNTLLPTLALLFKVPAPRLRVREMFVVKYEAAAAGGQPQLSAHRDGYTFSFSILLSEPAAFEGGGTDLVSLGLWVFLFFFSSSLCAHQYRPHRYHPPTLPGALARARAHALGRSHAYTVSPSSSGRCTRSPFLMYG